MAFLNYGGKYIFDGYRSHVTDILRSIVSFENSLHRQYFFGSKIVDEAPRLKPFIKSRWAPPRVKQISDTCAQLRDFLVRHYHPRRVVPNKSWFDIQALSWLKRSAGKYVIIDADKNLGDVITDRCWMDQEINRFLTDGFEALTETIAHERNAKPKNELISFSEEAYQHNIIKEKD